MNEIGDDQVIFATGGYDHTIKLWQTHTGICLRTLQQTSSQVNALAINPDTSSTIVSASYENIYVYDILSNTANAIITYSGTSKNVTDIGFQEDGKWMYTAGEDCRARIWDLRAKDFKCQKMFGVQGPGNTVCLHPNQVELFVGDSSGTIYRWDLRTDHDEQLIPDSDAVILDIAIDPTGQMMASVNNKGRCYIWNLKYGQADEPTKLSPRDEFRSHTRAALKCEFSPDSKYLVTTSADQTARVWATEDFSLFKELKHDNKRWVWDAAFSSDSQYLFTACSDGLARLWNLKTGNADRNYSGHQKAVTALAFKDNTFEEPLTD